MSVPQVHARTGGHARDSRRQGVEAHPALAPLVYSETDWHAGTFGEVRSPWECHAIWKGKGEEV